MDVLYTPYAHLMWIIPLILLIIYLGSPRFQGSIGLRQLKRLLAAALEKERYTVFHGLIFPSGGGTRQIDHLVVSQFGIFVIENEYRKGWISGSRAQDQWKQVNWGRISRFSNPVHQGQLKTELVQRLLGLPPSKFHSIVVLSGLKGFKTEMPENVVTAEKLIPRIRSKSQKLLSPDEAAQSLSGINEACVKPLSAALLNRWQMLRLALTAVLLAGMWLAYETSFRSAISNYIQQAEIKASPQLFTPSGQRKTEQQVWEDSLLCAYSVDTGRCASYEPNGNKLDLSEQRCKELAERGSILKQ